MYDNNGYYLPILFKIYLKTLQEASIPEYISDVLINTFSLEELKNAIVPRSHRPRV